MVVRKRSGIRRRLIVLGSSGGSIADLVRGVWRSDAGNLWLIPLAVFLCLFGLVLILATTVEALAPFIYAIF
jgi:vacuolar-type H+-ATPase subunit I/STV1